MRYLLQLIAMLTACEASHSIGSYSDFQDGITAEPRDLDQSRYPDRVDETIPSYNTQLKKQITLRSIDPNLPQRPSWSPSGSRFLKETALLSIDDREQVVYREIRSGNFPAFLRQLVPVTVHGEILDQFGNYRTATAVIRVMPDYLAIGSNDDFVRIPMNYYTATSLAKAFDLLLPTDRIVDAINDQAAVRASPTPLPSGPDMISNSYIAKHHRLIQRQLGLYPLGALVSGIKKDIVLAEKLVTHPNRIAIYGWHGPNGRPIQPLSDIHNAAYADYSHGVRLMSPFVEINGKLKRIEELLADWQTAPLFASEGRIHNVAMLINRVQPSSSTIENTRKTFLRRRATGEIHVSTH